MSTHADFKIKLSGINNSGIKELSADPIIIMTANSHNPYLNRSSKSVVARK
jgi:hypothetical protein